MLAMKNANLVVRLLAELGALVALGYWGFHTGHGALAATVLGLGAPLLMAVVWGLFVAPRAVVSLPAPITFVLGLVILLLAAVSLAAAGQPLPAWIFAAVILLNGALLLAFGAARQATAPASPRRGPSGSV